MLVTGQIFPPCFGQQFHSAAHCISTFFFCAMDTFSSEEFRSLGHQLTSVALSTTHESRQPHEDKVAAAHSGRQGKDPGSSCSLLRAKPPLPNPAGSKALELALAWTKVKLRGVGEGNREAFCRAQAELWKVEEQMGLRSLRLETKN